MTGDVFRACANSHQRAGPPDERATSTHVHLALRPRAHTSLAPHTTASRAAIAPQYDIRQNGAVQLTGVENSQEFGQPGVVGGPGWS